MPAVPTASSRRDAASIFTGLKFAGNGIVDGGVYLAWICGGARTDAACWLRLWAASRP
jgi:hypothetical protein